MSRGTPAGQHPVSAGQILSLLVLIMDIIITDFLTFCVLKNRVFRKKNPLIFYFENILGREK